MKSVAFEIANNSSNYRVLRIEPMGFCYGMDSQDRLKISISGDSKLEMYISDYNTEIVFTFKNTENLEIQVLFENEEIFSGHNILYN